MGVKVEAIVIDPQEVFTVVRPDCTFETTPLTFICVPVPCWVPSSANPEDTAISRVSNGNPDHPGATQDVRTFTNPLHQVLLVMLDICRHYLTESL